MGQTVATGAAYEGVCPGCGKDRRATLLFDYEAMNVPNTIEVGCRCGTVAVLMVKGTATLTAVISDYKTFGTARELAEGVV